MQQLLDDAQMNKIRLIRMNKNQKIATKGKKPVRQRKSKNFLKHGKRIGHIDKCGI